MSNHVDPAPSPGMDCPVSRHAAAFDPFSPTYLNDPANAVRWSRDEEPVFFSPNLGYWVVTRYEDVKAVFRDNLLFSPSIVLEPLVPPSPEAVATLQSYGFALGRTLVNEDEPEHMVRRRVLLEPFTPPHVVEHEATVRRVTRECVDRFVEQGRVDLVDGLFWEVPLVVALHFLGLDGEDVARIRGFARAHGAGVGSRPGPEQELEIAESRGKFWQYAGDVLARLRRDPSGPGWMPFSIRAQRDHPDVVTDPYLHSMMMAILAAAHETTTSATGNMLGLLLERREIWDQLRADPGLIPAAVEESLRHSGSIYAWRRLVTDDTTLGGVDLPKGARLLIVTSSANHDERHFDRPDSFEIHRENACDHLTFGYGAHQCLGKNLARMEMQIMLEELVRRLPHIRIVPDQTLAYRASISLRGLESLWVEWAPEDNPEKSDQSILDECLSVRVGEGRPQSGRHVQVETIERLPGEVVHLTLVDAIGDDLPAWTPGAHVDLELDGLTRQYSLCGDPNDRRRFEVGIALEPHSRGASRFAHEQLAVGDRLTLRGPRNHFRLDPTDEHSILVGAGIGVTPILAMADELASAGASYELHYCGRTRATMAYLERVVRDHGGRADLHISEEGTRLDVRSLRTATERLGHIYACGPQRLLDGLDEQSRHWPDDMLRVERFTTTGSLLDPSNEHDFDVVLADSDLTLRVTSDRTVLDTLRAAGIDIQSDCLEGLCGTCEAQVIEGAVDHRDLVLTQSERAKGERMMTCCSRASNSSITLRL
jgi:cytochrome P450/ferredoxin-NADP reductase